MNAQLVFFFFNRIGVQEQSNRLLPPGQQGKTKVMTRANDVAIFYFSMGQIGIFVRTTSLESQEFIAQSGGD